MFNYLGTLCFKERPVLYSLYLEASKDLDNMDRDVTRGWDNQTEEWSTFDEEIDAVEAL